MEDNTIRYDKLLNGSELIEFENRLQDYSITAKGQKYEEYNEDSEDIQKQIESSTDDLCQLLELKRISMSNKRSVGIYEEDSNRIRVNSILGKFSWLGYMENKNMYLKPHEALLLIEMNRLVVFYNEVIISLEQAYVLFFGKNSTLTMEEYYVFSNLSRIGYGVMIHDSEYDRKKFLAINNRKKVKKEDEMIWCVLLQKLNLPYKHEFVANERELYLKTKVNLRKHFVAISGHSYNDDDEDDDKELYQDEPPSKKLKSETNEVDSNNFIDILKTELQYISYEKFFQKFCYIKRKQFDKSLESSSFKFNFDVFRPKTHFKRTEQLASYRIIVITYKDEFPTHSQLEILKRQQAYDVPIVIATVSENMKFHYSLCVL
ncbi:hypothetical protein PVAND_011808 [Polypedilum vanderplanki]|uniref:tRNA-splicing endonuclease subunit Sen54 N-terminal domain-containing protein n=1 Tax=Polypedilum vanderplanki TaxID=319348 RepID=A0A9J6CJR5_POLVA|nr:hypothetical protein PVAND_011808 [Polypedilum vanderplanki]